MAAIKLKKLRRARRKRGLRKRLQGTAEHPRLSVFRSHQNLYAQIIDDERGATLCEASTLSKGLREKISYGGNQSAAKIVGQALAERALSKQITHVSFDRNGYRFHGRIKALAEAAREAGLRF
jgi:large subunit ribosomal protein L18